MQHKNSKNKLVLLYHRDRGYIYKYLYIIYIIYTFNSLMKVNYQIFKVYHETNRRNMNIIILIEL